MWKTTRCRSSPTRSAALLAASIEEAAAKLSPGARTVFLLHDVEGYTHEEIAAELGITAGGSKSQLFKARAKLRTLLAHMIDGAADTRIQNRAHMSHLSTERLAALGDEEPTAAESAHLAACADCARERAAYRTLVAMAHAERDAIGIPLTRWESIAGALANDTRSHAGRDARSRRAGRTGRRDARTHRALLPHAGAGRGGLLLLAGGAIAGRMSAGAPPVPVGSRDRDCRRAPSTAARRTQVAQLRDSVTFALHRRGAFGAAPLGGALPAGGRLPRRPRHDRRAGLQPGDGEVASRGARPDDLHHARGACARRRTIR